MLKVFLLVGCSLVMVNAGTYGGQKIGLEDIEKDYNSNQKSLTYTQPKASASVPSPTKFGFVPKRTIASYAATKPKPQYLQTQYKVKQSPHQTQSSQYQQQYTQPQTAYQQEYSTASTQQYTLPSSSNYAELYSSGSQQYDTQQQVQDYAYVQPEAQQQYSIQYQQPSQQYQQYENVQYISDNSIAKTESQPQQYYQQAPQPQFYYVQQYPAPSTAVESVIDPKAFQYVSYVPSYSPNSISIDQKQLEAYSTDSEIKLPQVTTTVARYTTGKSSGSKQHTSQKEVQYVVPSAKTQYYKQDQILFKREPKSLLDSYVPSILQLQYLKQQGKSEYSKF